MAALNKENAERKPVVLDWKYILNESAKIQTFI